MPVFINEVTAEVPQPQVSSTQATSVENTTKVSPTEYEFLMNLNIIEERKRRLDFD